MSLGPKILALPPALFELIILYIIQTDCKPPPLLDPTIGALLSTSSICKYEPDSFPSSKDNAILSSTNRQAEIIIHVLLTFKNRQLTAAICRAMEMEVKRIEPKVEEWRFNVMALERKLKVDAYVDFGFYEEWTESARYSKTLARICRQFEAFTKCMARQGKVKRL